MFTNVGGKIKTLAKVLFIIGAVFSVIIGIMLIVIGAMIPFGAGGSFVVIGILVIIGGILLSWVSVLTLYGFGEVIASTQEIAWNTRGLNGNTNQSAYTQYGRNTGYAQYTDNMKAEESDAAGTFCPSCGAENAAGSSFCLKCGSSLK